MCPNRDLFVLLFRSGVNLDEVLQRLAAAKKEVDKTKKNIKGLEMLRQVSVAAGQFVSRSIALTGQHA
jgi:prefoldin subunit 5